MAVQLKFWNCLNIQLAQLNPHNSCKFFFFLEFAPASSIVCPTPDRSNFSKSQLATQLTMHNGCKAAFSEFLECSPASSTVCPTPGTPSPSKNWQYFSKSQLCGQFSVAQYL